LRRIKKETYWQRCPRKFFCGLFLVFALQSSGYAEPVLGRDFLELETTVEPSPGAPVEVIEFFSYECRGCYLLGPDLDQWFQSNLNRVDLALVPHISNRRSLELARLYYTLLLMGELTKLHYHVFRAIHDDGWALWDTSEQYKWVETQGVNLDRFRETLSSDLLDQRVSESLRLSEVYPVSVTPTIMVGRRFWTTASMIQSRDRLSPILDYLVDRMRRK
jgi:thiol:disulfide interchange protein DsbA